MRLVLTISLIVNITSARAITIVIAVFYHR